MVSESGILYIEPSKNVSARPVIDVLTRKMTAAFRRGKPGRLIYRGWHTCACGAKSDNTDYTLPNGQMTNSLCIHYLAFHRDEIPDFQIQKILSLDLGEETPTEDEMAGLTGRRLLVGPNKR